METRPMTIGDLRSYLGQIDPGKDALPIRVDIGGGRLVQILVTSMSPNANADELWTEGEELGFTGRVE